MIASCSPSTEITIGLTLKEYESLRSHSLVGQISLHDGLGTVVGKKSLELIVCDNDRGNENSPGNRNGLSLQSFLENADFDQIERYCITLSPRKYQRLLSKGEVGVRVESVRIDIYVMGIL